MDENQISVSELQEMLSKNREVFILDVRPIDQRNEWRIAESTHIDAYLRLNKGDNDVLDEVNIPRNVPVVTVCAAGRTSLIASEALRAKGIKAFSLEGGMKAWNYAWSKAEVNFSSGLKVIQVRRPAKGVLSYLIGSGNEAIAIDAALDPEVYIQLAKDNGWAIKYVTDTHIHADFVSRTRELAIASEAHHVMFDKASLEYPFTPVADKQVLEVGTSKVQFLHTPGHTPESVTLIIDDVAIATGDTLFVDGVGRPDLKANSDEVVVKSTHLHHSLNLLLQLPGSMFVLPAHTSGTVSFDSKLVGERLAVVTKSLDILKLNQEEFVKLTLSRTPPTPPNYLSIATLNKKGSYEGHRLADLEAGGNHCAIA